MRERALFGALLHWFPSREEYAALTLYERDELRAVCAEINQRGGGRG